MRDSGIIAGAIIGFLIGLAGLVYISANASQTSPLSTFEILLLTGAVAMFQWAMSGIIPGALIGAFTGA